MTQVSSGPDRGAPVLVIRPESGVLRAGLRELWQARGLLYFFVWRDVKVRYKQTLLGVSWVFLQPVAQLLVFTFIGRKIGISSEGAPYPIFCLAGLLPWNYFAQSTVAASNSLVKGASMVSKVYFPRAVLPAASVASGLVDFGISFALMIGLMIYYQVPPTWIILAAPAFVGLAMLTAFGVGLWLSALNVRYRDVQHTISFMVQFWMFATPVFYSSSVVEGSARVLWALNPMVGVLEGFRWAVLGTVPSLDVLAVSAGATAMLLVTGLFYFHRMQRSFADVI